MVTVSGLPIAIHQFLGRSDQSVSDGAGVDRESAIGDNLLDFCDPRRIEGISIIGAAQLGGERAQLYVLAAGRSGRRRLGAPRVA